MQFSSMQDMTDLKAKDRDLFLYYIFTYMYIFTLHILHRDISNRYIVS